MGLSLKVFFLEGSRVIRVPRRQYERLHGGDRRVRFVQHAGKRLRCALAIVQTQDRRPVAVQHVDYVLVPFGPDGRVDVLAQQRARRLLADHISLAFGTVSEPVVDIGPYVASERYHREFRWTPTDSEAEAVLELALKTR